MGASREQVLSRHGEPKSQLATGNREVLYYPGERLVLRDGFVVEVEPIATERPRSRTPESEQAAANESASSPAGADAPPDAPGETTDSSSAAAPEAESSGVEPKLEIKRVLPPSANSVRPAPKAAAPVRSAPAPRAPSAASVPTATRSPAPDSRVTRSAAEPAAATTGAVAPEQSSDVAATDRSEGAPAEPEMSKSDATQPAAEDDAPKAATAGAAVRRIEHADVKIDALEATASAFTPRTYIIALLTIAGGVAYLVWRSRQRLLLLAATAVSRSPFSAPATVLGGGTVFDAAFLSSLEWKRFEELVVLYYSKTGVVASRTKSGPNAPVHIKISWKGEPRPFALVQCIARPMGLIDAKPLQELFNVLTAEDIRRGYVVTTGKFNVPARDFAEEKHITLLPGDIFLEKLNALPDAARAELMQEITAGDYRTPSCPKCDAKMSRSPDDSGMWRCATHPEESIPMG